LYGTHQLLICADNINVLGNNIDMLKKYMGTLIDTSKKVGQEVNTEKTKYMLMSYHQNAEQNCNLKIASRCFENMAKFRCLGMTVTN
jgi:hypothetical protein